MPAALDDAHVTGIENPPPVIPRRVLLVLPHGMEEAQLPGGLDEMNRGWDCRFASHGAEAFRLLQEAPCDAIVIDLLQRGLDGVMLARQVMERWPETLRVGLSAPSERETLQKAAAPVHQFLAKPCEVKVLKAVLARAFAGRDILSHASLRRWVSGNNLLPVVPALYGELMEELRSKEPLLERAGQIVARDIGLSAKMLQLVNSAFFGLGRPLTHPCEAAMFLGVETLKALVLSLQVFAQFQHLKFSQFSMEELWKHSWTTGVLARQICEAEHCHRDTVAEAFTAGLLHDLGKLILAANWPEKFQATLHAARQRDVALWEEEFQAYSASHAEVGGHLLASWGLPEAVVQAVAFHHRPEFARRQTFSAVTAVHVANSFSKRHCGAKSQWVNAGYLSSIGMSARLDEWRELCRESLQKRA